MARPKVTLRCPAEAFHSAGERIVEFSFPDGTGGLISFREYGGKKLVTLYRLDPSIKVVK